MPLTGLPNLGNTCYINTLLQCLFNNPHFKHVKKTSTLGKALCPVYDQYRKKDRVDTRLYTEFFQQCRKELAGLMDVAEQNDMQEFYFALVTRLIEGQGAEVGAGEAEARLKLAESRVATFQKGRDAEDLFFAKLDVAWWRDNKKTWSALVPAFTGQLVGQIKCAGCSYILQNPELFTNIDVDMTAGDLSASFAAFFAADSIDGWKCDRCGYVSGANRCIRLTRMPKTLVITLKRFDPLTGAKKNCSVTIPKVLTLPDETHVFDKEVTYRLFAIGCHKGNQFGGHYYAVLQDRDSGAWYKVDDDVVFEMRGNDMAGNEPYMLFYAEV